MQRGTWRALGYPLAGLLFLVIVLASARPVWAQTDLRPGAHAYRTSLGLNLLYPLDSDQAHLNMPGRLPSLRAGLKFQVTPRFGWQAGFLRLAPERLNLNAGYGGAHFNLSTGAIRLSLFGDAAYGDIEAAVDSGGFYGVDSVGTEQYTPFLRPVTQQALGVGGGAALRVIVAGFTVEALAGYWHFLTTEDLGASGLYAGVGAHFSFLDRPWWWRTSGRDLEGPRLFDVQPPPGANGAVAAPDGMFRIRIVDGTGVKRIVASGVPATVELSRKTRSTEAGEVVSANVRADLRPGMDTVAFVAEDVLGNRSRFELAVQGPADERGPTITDLTPATGEVSDSVVTLRGMVLDASGVRRVLVGDQEARLSETDPPGDRDLPWYVRAYAFDIDVALRDGPNALSIVAEDIRGNQNVRVHDLQRFVTDTEAPRITITTPARDTVLTQSPVLVVIHVNDRSPLRRVTVNGFAATPSGGRRGIAPEGAVDPGLGLRYEARIPLEAGAGRLEAEAEDAAGNVGRAVRNVQLALAASPPRTESGGPRIEIRDPAEWSGAGLRGFAAVQKSSIRVVGFARDLDGVREVLVNGQPAAIMMEDGDNREVQFTGYAPVDSNTRQVEVAAWSEDGRRSARVFDVNARPAAGGPSPDAYIDARRFAVIIGISQYSDPDIPDLEYADDDARAFYDFVRSDAAGLGGIPDENIRLLVDDDATFLNIRSALFGFLEQSTEQDVVYVFLAAHGVPNPNRLDELYILPHDGRVDDIAATAFPMADVNEAVSRLYARHAVLFVDACHSGGVGFAAGTRGRSDPSLNAINQIFLEDLRASQSGLAVLTASEARQLSQEGEQWGGHGVFTHFLLDGLYGAADMDHDRIVRLGELMEYTRSRVIRATNNAQIPAIGSASHDRFLPLAIVTGNGEGGR